MTTIHATAGRSVTDPPLSRRARLLLRLERFFPVLDAPATGEDIARWELAKASGSYARAVEELGGLAGKRVLDFGCGWGGETAWLAERAAEAIGCDIALDSLRHAEALRRELGRDNLRFVVIGDDNRLPLDDDSIDAVLSTNVFEHVMDLDAALSEIARVLKPGGSFVSTFGPLFYSPLGYHVCWATQVPYAHLLVGLQPIAEVCRLKRGGPVAHMWRDMGLNRATFGRFRRAVRCAGLQPRRLRRIPVRGMHTLTALPGVGSLFTFGVDCCLVKPG